MNGVQENNSPRKKVKTFLYDLSDAQPQISQNLVRYHSWKFQSDHLTMRKRRVNFRLAPSKWNDFIYLPNMLLFH